MKNSNWNQNPFSSNFVKSVEKKDKNLETFSFGYSAVRISFAKNIRLNETCMIISVANW